MIHANRNKELDLVTNGQKKLIFHIFYVRLQSSTSSLHVLNQYAFIMKIFPGGQWKSLYPNLLCAHLKKINTK